MRNTRIQIARLLVVVVLAATSLLLAGCSTAGAANATPTPASTVTIRPASEIAGVSASGNIDLAVQQPVVFQVQGLVTSVPVHVGDNVKAGDTLATLDTTDLQRAVQQAQLNLQASQAQLNKLVAPPLAADVTSAQADLASAQAQLKSAQANYDSVVAQPDPDTVQQAKLKLEQAKDALYGAQGSRDAIAGNKNSSPAQKDQAQASVLQNEMAVQLAQLAYDDAQKPATADQIQSAQAQVESAKAQVASAQDKLDQLQAGASEPDQQAAEISVKQAQLNLDTAQANLVQATLTAPITGTLLAVNVGVGQMVSAGTEAVTLGDLSTLELVVDVAEVDVSRVSVGQPAQISVDALPGKTFNGAVERIAPSSTSVSGVVNYQVTTRLIDQDLSEVRPGMTAVATLVNQQENTGWLVPTDALHNSQNGTYVLVVQNGKQTQVNVTTGPTQGEWTIVYSPDLHAGDAVAGSVASYLNQQQGGLGGPGGAGGFRQLSPGAGGGRGD